MPSKRCNIAEKRIGWRRGRCAASCIRSSCDSRPPALASPAHSGRRVRRNGNFPLPFGHSSRIDKFSSCAVAHSARSRCAVSEAGMGGLASIERRNAYGDMEAILESISAPRRTVRKSVRRTRTVVFDALAANGFTRVNVTFDGEGDSGQIDNLAGYVGDVFTKLPEMKDHMLQASGWSDDKIDHERQSLTDAIEPLCYDYPGAGAWRLGKQRRRVR